MASIVLSCIQPTSEIHIGNYFGAVANWKKLQEEHTCYYGIVDLHAMTVPYDSAQLRANTERMFVDLLACEIDPEKATLFIQSLVPQHAELGWTMNCFCGYGELGRMTQFKDKSQLISTSTGSDDFISAGLFTYPVLQSADILLYRAHYVPVGQDQQQHLELSREIARRFNQRCGGEYFPEPKPLFTETPKIMSLSDPTRKMSKSAGEKHYIGLFEEEDSLRAKVKTAVTDSGQEQGDAPMSPGVSNMIQILLACGKDDVANELQDDYKQSKLRYVNLKGAVADALAELTGEFRARRDAIAADENAVRKQMHDMSAKARAVAEETMTRVYELAGLPKREW